MSIYWSLFLVLVGSSTAIISRAQQAVGAPPANKSLQTKLLQMKTKDQRYRNELHDRMKQISSTSTQPSAALTAMFERQGEIDRKNMARLEEIIQRHGWPGKTLVGGEATNAAFLILQHSSLSDQKKYFPLLKQGVTRNEVRPGDAAMLEDRILVGEGKKQIYGSHVHSGSDTGWKLELHPIEDEEHVDERRARVGLMPLAEYLKEFGLEYKRPTKL
jgi:hypothetical protein